MSVRFPLLDELRDWQRAVCEWLGVDPALALAVHDNLGTLARPKREEDPLYLSIDMDGGRGLPAQPVRGKWLGWDAFVSDGFTRVTAKVALDWQDERDLLAAVGPKPSFMSIETELMLRGLASESTP